MRKSLFAFVVLAFVASAVPASAQAIRWGYIPQTPDGWYYKIQGDQVGMLTADNLGMVRGLTNQLRQSEIRSLADDLMWNGAAYGINTNRGFYPMYDRQMRPMGRREATATGAVIGAGAGYAIFGNTRGTVAGAVVGGVVGLLTHRGNGNNGNQNVVVTPPVQEQGGVRVGPDGIPVAIGSRPEFTPPSTRRGEWRVANRTSKRADLYDGDELIVRLQPGQSIQVPTPVVGYSAVLLIPNRSGGIDNDDAQMRDNVNFSGWDIVAPVVQ